MNKYNNKLICIDLDWTLCEWEFWWWEEPKPIQDRIDYINENLYHKWAHIIIYTARADEYYTLTKSWLIKYWVKHHWIAMQYKPWADLYIDDKAINADMFFNNTLWESKR